MTEITENFIQQVKINLDLVEVAADYVDLEKSGKNYRALCPFHQEDTPSFTINPREQFFYCFGCGEGGDVISFIMEIDNLSFMEALRSLSERAGLEMPAASEEDKARRRIRNTIFKANKLAAKFYNYLLLEKDAAEPARKYLQDRGFGQEEMKKFSLGFAPPAWKALTTFLVKKNFSQKNLVRAGLIAEGKNNSYYDRFRNRIIFPIFNVRDEVIGFGGRIIDPEDKPKYLNSPETLIFSKKHVLYGLNWARKSMRASEEAVVVEGYTDVISAHKHGLNNFVASLGTSFTEQQAELLNRYAERVYIAFDADSAGDSATLRGLEILRETGLEVNIINLPNEKDPDDFLQAEGKEAFVNLQGEAPSLIDYRLDRILDNYGLSVSEQKIKAVNKAVDFLATIEDDLTREVYGQKLADKAGIPADNILEELEDRRNRKLREQSSTNYDKKNTGSKAGNQKNLQKLEWKLLAALISAGTSSENYINKLQKGFFSEKAADVFEMIRQKSSLNVSDLFSRLDNEKKDKLAEFLFAENRESFTEEKLDDLIAQLKHNFASKQIKKLGELLNSEGERINIEDLNNIIIYYRRLLEMERG